MLYFPSVKLVAALVPKDSPVMQFMTEFDPDYIEVVHYGTLVESHRTTTGLWGSSLDTMEMLYGPATWVCPD